MYIRTERGAPPFFNFYYILQYMENVYNSSRGHSRPWIYASSSCVCAHYTAAIISTTIATTTTTHHAHIYIYVCIYTYITIQQYIGNCKTMPKHVEIHLLKNIYIYCMYMYRHTPLSFSATTIKTIIYEYEVCG